MSILSQNLGNSTGTTILKDPYQFLDGTYNIRYRFTYPSPVTIPKGDPNNLSIFGYNLLTGVTTAEEDKQNTNIVHEYYDKDGNFQQYFLDDSNPSKVCVIFPAPSFTYNRTYSAYKIRILANCTYPALSTNQIVRTYLRARRCINDTVVLTSDGIEAQNIQAGDRILQYYTGTFVTSDSDSFVQQGIFFEILNDLTSSLDSVVNSVDIIISM